MIRLENIHKSFGSTEVLKGVNLHVAEGEKLVIIGPSGSGKSTLIRCMNYLEEPMSGQVYIHNHLMSKKRRAFINKIHSSMVLSNSATTPRYPMLWQRERLTHSVLTNPYSRTSKRMTAATLRIHSRRRNTELRQERIPNFLRQSTSLSTHGSRTEQ